MWRYLAFLLATFMAVAPVHAQCLTAGEEDAIAEGRLAVNNDAIILKLPEPVCLDGTEDGEPVPPTTEIHVFGADDTVQQSLRELIGKDVHLRGRMMEAHTQYHMAPIIMEVSEADGV